MPEDDVRNKRLRCALAASGTHPRPGCTPRQQRGYFNSSGMKRSSWGGSGLRGCRLCRLQCTGMPFSLDLLFVSSGLMCTARVLFSACVLFLFPFFLFLLSTVPGHTLDHTSSACCCFPPTPPYHCIASLSLSLYLSLSLSVWTPIRHLCLVFCSFPFFFAVSLLSTCSHFLSYPHFTRLSFGLSLLSSSARTLPLRFLSIRLPSLFCICIFSFFDLHHRSHRTYHTALLLIPTFNRACSHAPHARPRPQFFSAS